jgi:hypothetical protein
MVGALYLVRTVLATPTPAFALDALLGLANLAAPRCSGGLTTSTSTLTLPFLPHLPRLRRHLSSTSTTALTTSTLALFPRRLPRHVSIITMAPLVRLQLHRHGNPTTITSTLALFNIASSTTTIVPSRSATSTSAQRPTALHEDSSASSPAVQPQHTQRVDCYDCGGMFAC